MPYIPQDKRRLLRLESKGELEYVLYKTAIDYLFAESDKPNFDRRHDVVYAVQHVADELRRRHLDPYEDEKIKENGDIF